LLFRYENVKKKFQYSENIFPYYGNVFNGERDPLVKPPLLVVDPERFYRSGEK